MCRLLRNTFVTTAKAALIVTGVGFGLLRGLRLFDSASDPSDSIRSLEDRLDGMQLQIQALHGRNEQIEARLRDTVTNDDLNAALERALGKIQSGIDSRFEEQMRSAEALRAMVGQTDELLERLLERIESMNELAPLEHAAS